MQVYNYWKGKKKVFESGPGNQPDMKGYSYILEKQLKPEARKEIIELFHKFDIKPSSMIDISDGLSSDILHICNASKVGCQIFENKIPLHDETVRFAEEININPINLALNGGEDYELLFTISPEQYEKIKGIPEIKQIGQINKNKSERHLILSGGDTIELSSQGWNPLKN